MLEGDDNVPQCEREAKNRIIEYINTADIEKTAVDIYESTPIIFANVNNIYPYGIIECSYMAEDENGEEAEYTTDIMVYDEMKEQISHILLDIEKEIDLDCESFSDEIIKGIARDMYFKYAENMTGDYVGLSSGLIYDLIKSYLAGGQIPEIHKLTDRVDLFEVATQIAGVSEDKLDKCILEIWNTRKDIHKWYNFSYYEGLMKVYRQRIMNTIVKNPEFIIPDKEEMDMGTLKKYFPEYYEELREYVFQTAYDIKTGRYVASQPSENGEYYSSPHRKLFEIDHIVPISKGGKTIKENLQLLYCKDNRKKGNRV